MLLKRSMNLDSPCPPGLFAEPCAQMFPPLVGAISGGIVGWGYDFPVLPMFYPNPPDSREPTSIGFGQLPTVWKDNQAISLNTTWQFEEAEIGAVAVDLWANNCVGSGKVNGFAQTQFNVQDSGWATGEPRALLVNSPGMDIETPVYNFANFFLWQSGVTSVVVQESGGGTTYYSGLYGATMNSAAFQCSDVGNKVLDFILTNATGSITLTSVLYIQDNNATCPS